MSRILVVDDEAVVLDTLRPILSKAGHQVQVATDGETALFLARQDPPDLVILDVMLPKIDGLQVCRILRRESSVPILMLTAMGEEADKVLGLEVGADDYLTKPFGASELLARVKALLRRVQASQAAAEAEVSADRGLVLRRLQQGDLEVDLVSGRATLAGVPLSLKPREFDLLAFLMHHRGQAFSPGQLLKEVWGYMDASDTRTVAVHIHRLREKLKDDLSEPKLIQTVRGAGYRFTP